MESRKTISYRDAITRARNLKLVPGAYFTLLHLTCNLKTGECGAMRKYERCRVRPALRSDTFRKDGDLYFTYENLDTGEPKMCYKSLMRYIAFPPEYELLKICYTDD